MPPSKPQTRSEPVQSYLLRVVEQRVLSVSTVYELQDIATGARRRFESLAALHSFLAHQQRSAGPQP